MKIWTCSWLLRHERRDHPANKTAAEGRGTTNASRLPSPRRKKKRKAASYLVESTGCNERKDWLASYFVPLKLRPTQSAVRDSGRTTRPPHGKGHRKADSCCNDAQLESTRPDPVAAYIFCVVLNMFIMVVHTFFLLFAGDFHVRQEDTILSRVTQKVQ